MRPERVRPGCPGRTPLGRPSAFFLGRTRRSGGRRYKT
jgi:hypothetical protein